MNSEFEMEVNNTEEAACYNCATQNYYCEFNAPSFDSFEPNGMFGHIKLPLTGDQEIPEDLLRYIYGVHYTGRDNIPDYIMNSLKDAINAIGRLPSYIKSLENNLNRVLNTD